MSSRLSDLKIHSFIDKLNPNLHSIETTSGQKRVRKFYVMSPEDAYSLLEVIAEIHGCADKLKIVKPNVEETLAEETAQESDTGSAERASNFSFTKCQIPVNDRIEYAYDNSKKARVVDDRNVEYNGVTMSLTALAKELSGKKYSIAGPKFFKYKGEWPKRPSPSAERIMVC